MRNSTVILFTGCTLRTTTSTAEELLIQTRENHLQDTPLSERSRAEWRACICFCVEQEGMCTCVMECTHTPMCVHTHIYTYTYRLTHTYRPMLSLEDAREVDTVVALRETGRPRRGTKPIFFIVFINLFNDYLSSTYNVPGRQHTKEIHKILSFWRLHPHRRDNQ